MTCAVLFYSSPSLSSCLSPSTSPTPVRCSLWSSHEASFTTLMLHLCWIMCSSSIYDGGADQSACSSVGHEPCPLRPGRHQSWLTTALPHEIQQVCSHRWHRSSRILALFHEFHILWVLLPLSDVHHNAMKVLCWGCKTALSDTASVYTLLRRCLVIHN